MKTMSKRPIGKPKIRWEDDVLEDINSMNVRNWKNVAQNRDRVNHTVIGHLIVIGQWGYIIL